MDSLSYKTRFPKPGEIQRKWYLVDAENQTMGRLSSRIAHILRGKNKPTFSPHLDTGDYVIVINAEKIRFTGKKKEDKVYLSYSLYPGGQKSVTAAILLQKRPIVPVEKAVRGMLPKNKLGDQMYRKLFVYAGAVHPHEAQQPENIQLI